MENKALKISGEVIEPGQLKEMSVTISRLPTHTPVEIPITIYRAKEPGPVLLLSGGIHGDEINGVEIVRRIIVNKHHRVKAGTVICMPIINVHGFLNFSREVPDGKDINRSFPGAKKGSLASQMAYFLQQRILPIIDYGIDFHTGGSRINNYPQIRADLGVEENEFLAKAFGCKYVINAPYREKSFRRAADKMGKSLLVYEGGESLRLRKHAIDEGVEGTLRVMKALNMIESAPEPRRQPIIIKESRWIRATTAGLYHSFVRPGEYVEKKGKLGLITDPFGEFEKPFKSTITGHVIAVNTIPVVNRGDALIHIGLE